VPHNLEITLDGVCPISQQFSEEQVSLKYIFFITTSLILLQIAILSENYLQLEAHQKAYFLWHQNQTHSLQSKLKDITDTNHEEYYFAFADYISVGNHPKSQLKNYIIFLLHYWLVKKILKNMN
jgi:hypothetical protein